MYQASLQCVKIQVISIIDPIHEMRLRVTDSYSLQYDSTSLALRHLMLDRIREMQIQSA